MTPYKSLTYKLIISVLLFPLQNILLAVEEYQSLDDCPEITVNNKKLIEFMNTDSIISRYNSTISPLVQNSANYYRLSMGRLATCLTKKDYPDISNADELNKYFIPTVKKYFNKEISGFLLLQQLGFIKMNARSINAESARLIWEEIQKMPIKSEYKNKVTIAYTEYKKSVKTLSDIMNAELVAYDGKRVPLNPDGRIVLRGTDAATLTEIDQYLELKKP